MDYSPPGSSVHGILQAKYWSGLLFPPPWDLPDSGIELSSATLQAGSLLSEPPDISYDSFPLTLLKADRQSKFTSSVMQDK